jgi:hypothetical protein
VIDGERTTVIRETPGAVYVRRDNDGLAIARGLDSAPFAYVITACDWTDPERGTSITIPIATTAQLRALLRAVQRLINNHANTPTATPLEPET